MRGKSTWKWEVLEAGDDLRGQMEMKIWNCKVGKCGGKGQCKFVTFGQEMKMPLGVCCKKSDDSY
jgi:hypothetical protein